MVAITTTAATVIVMGKSGKIHSRRAGLAFSRVNLIIVLAK
jgi:hypothetical protein